jgi:transglutaminase-like putative cysteine protease
MRYAGPAGESVNEIRLSPSDNGRQRVEWAHVRVEPAAELLGHTDSYGNVVRWFQVVGPHETLVVESEAIVVTRPAPRHPASAGGDLAELDDPAYVERYAEFLSPSDRVRWAGPVADFGDALALALDEGEGALAWARRLEAEVNRAIVYTTGATRVDTPIEDVVQAGAGVCQDMAHLMIALCRRRGMAARYVSGWLHLPGIERPGESHAWVEAAVPGLGWVELDPTHPDPAHEDYVRLAVGRDYADVPPLRGSYLGPATEGMSVVVEVKELPA